MSLRVKLPSLTTSTILTFTFALAYSGCSSPPTEDNRGPVSMSTGTNSGSGGSTGTSGGTGSGTSGGTGTGGDNTGAGGDPTGTGGGGGAPGTGGGGGAGGSAVAAGCGACPANVQGHCDANATYPPYPGYTLQMAEDFCTPLDLDTDKIWTWSDGAPADGDTWFQKNQIGFANGNMTITAIKMDLPAGYTSFSESGYNSMTGKPTGRHFVSGELRTKYNNYRYGHYEVRFKAPTTVGGFLSTMFAFRTPKWQTWNEVDLELEPMDGTKDITKQVAGNVVYFKNTGAGVPGYPGGAAFDALPTGVPTYVINETHTYAFDWTATKITWYLDGHNIHEYAGPQPKIPDLASKIMMNLWVFAGPHFGDPTGNVYPLKSEYEWFRFYKQDGETYPCTATPGCLQAADTAFAKNNMSEATYP
jgi:beta-glucanase (GH16 family)